MNILAMKLERACLPEPLLDWMTQPSNGAGVNCDTYWIIDTKVGWRISNESQDLYVEHLIDLLKNCHKDGYSQLMITKKPQLENVSSN